ncbi:class I SAM-dependent methyltransferase [Verticiella sediminum]|uniref:Class I SAM-dependent methyltransferase n=1 Tax=Verticiella sediminum TaxID=1247510 RepID=A0A556B0D6_9BURK|nr:class I SAM-dependent methyltransferase [Verticiella sediminum]TSH98658.1 class I SAM-dependent methyltransferase [Verticiella sediminum]
MSVLQDRVATRFNARSTAGAALVSSLFLLGACAQAAAPAATESAAASTTYEPTVGQAGKDVVWVPTPQVLVDTMLDLAKVTPQDYLMDLGSGDGRTVITAAKRGLTARGIEYNPDMVALAKSNAEKEGVSDKATFEQADLFETDFSKANVITMFLLPSINEKLAPKLVQLEPGTRIVSNSFRMGSWQPDQEVMVTDNCTSWCNALLWIVPAQVEGNWQIDGQPLVLEQDYQMLTGTLGGQAISEGKLLGNAITFKVGDVTYEGTVESGAIKGKTTGGKSAEWHAVKG